MNAGDTFKRAGGMHLWVVVSDPDKNPDQVAVVNMTDADHNRDHSCVLSPGEHPYVIKKTCMFYQRCKTITKKDFDVQLSCGAIKLYDPVDSVILQRIRDGAMISQFTPEGVKNLFVVQGLAALPP